MTMLLSSEPTDAEAVAVFRATAVYLVGESHKALAGLCVNLAWVFRDAAQKLYRAAELIEQSSGNANPDASVFGEFERTESSLKMLESWVHWPEIDGYIAELEFRRTGQRPVVPATRASAPKIPRPLPRYLVAELVPTFGPVPFEFATDDAAQALEFFTSREALNEIAFGQPLPLVLLDRHLECVLRQAGNVEGFDLLHRGY